MSQPIIGILAGMGTRSTAPFIDLVVTQCQKQYGARNDIDFPKMLICSQPAPFYEDRPVDHPALEAAILDGLLTLQSAGADFLAIACNTAHMYYSSLAAMVQVPLLNIVKIAVESVPRHARVALVASRPTVESGIYQKELGERRNLLLPQDWQDQVDAMLAATRDSVDPVLFSSMWKKLIDQAEECGADAILIACLDLSGVVRHAVTEVPLLDAAECLAHAMVKKWLQLRKDQSSKS